MKTIKLTMCTGVAVFMLAACEQEERVKIRKEAIAEIAKNVGKVEREKFLRGNLRFETGQVEACRKRVENAATPNELALATEDLRQANDQMNRTIKEIEDLD